MVDFNDRYISLMHNYAIPAAIEAGYETLKFFRKSIPIEYKSDNSPLTEADIAANNIIIAKLAATNIPVISEESSSIAYETRKNWELFWIIDPIDGTKEFVKGGDDYTINIALIHNRVPVVGVIFAPVLNNIYFGYGNGNAYKAQTNQNHNLVSILKLPHFHREIVTIVSSKSHKNVETQAFVENIKARFGNVETANIGSSLKFCLIAEGTANVYPRIGAINEWDIAAGHAIVRAAGGKVLNITTGEELIYNSVNLKTQDFVAGINSGLLMQILEN